LSHNSGPRGGYDGKRKGDALRREHVSVNKKSKSKFDKWEPEPEKPGQWDLPKPLKPEERIMTCPECKQGWYAEHLNAGVGGWVEGYCQNCGFEHRRKNDSPLPYSLKRGGNEED
jgi:hypothetical protein